MDRTLEDVAEYLPSLKAPDGCCGSTGWETDDADYPRRQFQRANWVNLNGTWHFAYDPAGLATEPGDITDWSRSITVPFAPESELSGVGDRGFHSHLWYQREFELQPAPTKRVLLHFGAVDYHANVWVNDSYVGEHEGGHTPFSFDITDALIDHQAVQTVTVFAHDDPHDLAKPRGKQDWQLEPHSIWYDRTSGIWQTVWLEEVSMSHIDHVQFTSQLERWEIGCEAFMICPLGIQTELRVRLSIDDHVLADDRYQVLNNEVHRRIALSDPGIDDYRNTLLWTPEKPTLIRVDLELIYEGRTIDEVRSYTAIRGISLQRGRILLNNRPYYLRLVLDQGYWPESLMTPPSQGAIIRDIELVKEAGFNGVRKHQKIEDPRYLYWADRLGLLVWEEMPSAYRFTHESVKRLTTEWMEVIDRDYNHPSIIVWVPFNESWGVPDLPDKAMHRSFVQALYHLTRTLDTTRPVIGNDGWESGATDILGIHDYDDDPEHFTRRYGDGAKLPDYLINGFPGGRVLTLDGHPHEGQPVMLTEFGGIAHTDPGSSERKAWGYSVSDTSEGLRSQYIQLLDAVNRVEIFSGFCYTQFADTYQESNGLFFENRTPKFDLNSIQAATRGTKRLPQEVDTSASELRTPAP
ncbi:MAG TPA: glycoside hydrolase family 2 TIM barrel-domain containing protein [Glaciibacter sp.]|nr:glycoside hydrolase family 2 TIM barrel-domain containing protein [Glaciibacter sp.]